MAIREKRGRGRPKKRWLDMIESDMKRAGVSIEETGHRVEWKFRTKVADPK